MLGSCFCVTATKWFLSRREEWGWKTQPDSRSEGVYPQERMGVAWPFFCWVGRGLFFCWVGRGVWCDTRRGSPGQKQWHSDLRLLHDRRADCLYVVAVWDLSPDRKCEPTCCNRELFRKWLPPSSITKHSIYIYIYIYIMRGKVVVFWWMRWRDVSCGCLHDERQHRIWFVVWCCRAFFLLESSSLSVP